MKDIYVILLSTGTVFGRVIEMLTNYPYSHVVLSLDDTFTKLYSFGRLNPKNPFNGGFVTYGINSDFYQNSKKSECVIYKCSVDTEHYIKLLMELNKFEGSPEVYGYYFWGVITRFFFHKVKKVERKFVCSTFVASVLSNAEIIDLKKPPEYTIPQDFANVPQLEKVYEGRFRKRTKNE